MDIDLDIPARLIGTNRRSLTGYVTADGKSHPFESSLERDFYCLLSFSKTVQSFHPQPVTIPFVHKGKKRRYTPDTLVIYRAQNEPITLYEVKYREDLRNDWSRLRPAFKAAIRYGKEHGYRFRIMTEREIRTPYLKNIKFLAHCGNQERHSGHEEQVVRTLASLGESTPGQVLQVAYRNSTMRLFGLHSLWSLISRGRIEADLNQPLSLQTPIWVVFGEGFVPTGPPYPP